MPTRCDRVEDLVRHLALAHREGRLAEAVDLTPLNRILEYTPEDMTVTVQTGLTLAALQTSLRAHNQWLPLDPPSPAQLTIATLLCDDLHGPRRFGYGTVRDYVLGLTVALPDGRLVKSGGKVVKNVAGFDLAKLFIGSQGTLGIPVEVCFKLLPRPEEEAHFHCRCPALDDAAGILRRVLQSDLNPVQLDLHCVATPDTPPGATPVPNLVVRVAGSREQVDWQCPLARELGLVQCPPPAAEALFWDRADSSPVQRYSVLPSRLISELRKLAGVEWIARAGNGLIYYRGGPAPPRQPLPLPLLTRLKQTFDPKGVLPPLPWS